MRYGETTLTQVGAAETSTVAVSGWGVTSHSGRIEGVYRAPPASAARRNYADLTSVPCATRGSGQQLTLRRLSV